MVYLGLGSNLGQREANLRQALERLSQKVDIEQVSSFYDTEPVGYLDQPRFLNAVCCGRTRLSPTELLDFIKGLEREMGRLPGFLNGPRLIDIDILFYNALVMKTSELEVPHPRLAERAFVLVPLAEIAPDLVHPVSGKTAKQLLEALGSVSEVRLLPVGEFPERAQIPVTKPQSQSS